MMTGGMVRMMGAVRRRPCPRLRRDGRRAGRLLVVMGPGGGGGAATARRPAVLLLERLVECGRRRATAARRYTCDTQHEPTTQQALASRGATPL